MRGHDQELQALGATVAFVGTGTVAMASSFANEHAGPHAVFADPQRRAFALAAMRRGVWSMLRPRFVANLWRALRHGFRQSRVQGDPWQHGGLVLLSPTGKVLHLQRDGTAGDVVDFVPVLAALRAAH